MLGHSQIRAASILTLTAVAPLAFTAVDDLVLEIMKKSAIRAAQVAIVWGRRLAYTVGYTLAEAADYPITTPTVRMRIVSMSKPVTATLLMTQWESGLFNLDDPGIDNVASLAGFAPAASGFYSRSVGQLLSHLARFNDAFIYNMATPAAILAAIPGATLPLAADDLLKFVATLAPIPGFPPVPNVFLYPPPGEFDPAKQLNAAKQVVRPVATYSNFGYYLAGEIGRKLSGKISLQTACGAAIWERIGAERPRATNVFAADAWVDAETGHEVLYHPVFPGYGGSIAKANGLLEPNWYDTYAIPQELAPSGWAMAAADYARFLTAFAEPTNPLFEGQGTQAEMLHAISAAGGGAFARGFGLVSEAGHAYVWHNGGFPGSSSFGFLKDDGLVVVFIANRNTSYNQFGGGWATQFAQVIDNAVTTPGPEHDLWSAVDLDGAS